MLSQCAVGRGVVVGGGLRTSAADALSQMYHTTCTCRRSLISTAFPRRALSTLSPSPPPSQLSPLPSPPSTSSPSCTSPPSRLNLLNYTSSELSALLLPLGVPSYRSSQLFHFIYRKGLTSFDPMTSLSLSLRSHLSSLFTIEYPRVLHHQTSSDGTRKLLLGLPPGDSVESVYIPMRDRGVEGSGGVAGAVCISSQVACSLRCAFCATGAMDKAQVRNLQPSEIVGQVMQSLHLTGDYSRALPSSSTPYVGGGEALTNIVFMGQGEPGYNIRSVCKALSILSDHHGLAFGRKRITVSTSGVVPAIDRLREMGVRLAVSLHAVRDDLRDELVPINKTWKLHELMQACQRFQSGTGGGAEGDREIGGSRGRITFEYVMLDGVNDGLTEARELTRLLRKYHIDGLINLIPFNPWPGSEFQTSKPEAIYAFADECGKTHPTTIRWPKGGDINAACGQLRGSLPSSSTSESNEGRLSLESL